MLTHAPVFQSYCVTKLFQVGDGGWSKGIEGAAAVGGGAGEGWVDETTCSYGRALGGQCLGQRLVFLRMYNMLITLQYEPYIGDTLVDREKTRRISDLRA
jgi:hypothetical protein